MYCKYCGSLIDEGSSFCSHCGKRQDENATKPSKTSGTKLSLHKCKSKKKVLFFVLGGLLLLLVIWLIVSLFNRQQIADITIDKVSRELAEATKNYDKLDEFHEGLARVCKNDKYGFIDKLGHEIIPCIYDDAEDFDLGVSIVEKDEKAGAINKQGKMVIPCIYDNIHSFGKDSLAVAFLNEKSGFIDLSGNVIIPFDYEFCYGFSEGLSAVRQDGLYGFINRKGELVIPCKYTDFRGGFSEGLVGVNVGGGKWGYIDTTGEIAIPFRLRLTGHPFSFGLSTCSRGGWEMSYENGHTITRETPFEMAFINKKGELVSEYFELSDIRSIRDGYFVIWNKKYGFGLINRWGELVIPCKYSSLYSLDDKYVAVELNGNVSSTNCVLRMSKILFI